MVSAKRDHLAFPETVKDSVGAALSVAQFGGKHRAAKPWKGEGRGVLEIFEDHSGNTFRVVYNVRFAEAVYVLQAFQKKSPRAIKTARRDLEFVSERLKQSRRKYRSVMPKNEKDPIVTPSSGNVFADLGFADAESARRRFASRLRSTRSWSGGVSPRPEPPGVWVSTSRRSLPLPISSWKAFPFSG